MLIGAKAFKMTCLDRGGRADAVLECTGPGAAHRRRRRRVLRFGGSLDLIRISFAVGFVIALERVPIKWNHLIDKDSLRIKELEQVLIEKSRATFRDMLVWLRLSELVHRRNACSGAANRTNGNFTVAQLFGYPG
jgi:hypothetical protein